MGCQASVPSVVSAEAVPGSLHFSLCCHVSILGPSRWSVRRSRSMDVNLDFLCCKIARTSELLRFGWNIYVVQWWLDEGRALGHFWDSPVPSACEQGIAHLPFLVDVRMLLTYLSPNSVKVFTYHMLSTFLSQILYSLLVLSVWTATFGNISMKYEIQASLAVWITTHKPHC